MEALPREIVVNEVLLKLSPKDILNACIVNKSFQKLFDDRLWSLLLERDFSSNFSLFVKLNLSNKDLYKLLYGLKILKDKLKLKETLYEISNFRILKINNAHLESIPKEIENLQNLEELYLYYNKILLTSIPCEIFNLKNLQKLYLNNNELTSIPHEVGQLQNLQELALDNNQLKSIPKEIGLLQNLQYLRLHNNKLNYVPKELGLLSNLKYLDLSHNQLMSIPKELSHLQNLERLYLQYNRLVELPRELGYFQNLKYLHLDKNLVREKEILNLQPKLLIIDYKEIQPGHQF